MGTAWASSGASNFDRQMQFFQPSVTTPIRGSETFLEATYQFQVLPSWQIQPDVQYFINPGSRNRQPGRTHAADQERIRASACDERELLTRLVGQAVDARPSQRLAQLTPSLRCRLVDDVVYWNVSFLSG